MKTSNICLRRVNLRADKEGVWIDRIVTETPEGAQEIDLHARLTVISSADRVRRREAYERILGALQAKPGSTIQVRTEYGDSITATRGVQGGAALFDTNNNLPIASDDRGLGIVGQLNYGHDMASHLELFHVTPERLRARAEADKDLIKMAQAPLDQLFGLAARITKDESELSSTRERRTSLHESIRERETKEESLQHKLEEHSDGRRKVTAFALAAMAIVALGLAAAFAVHLILGLVLCVIGSIVAAVGRLQQKSKTDEDLIAGEALDIQLGRVDELFDTHSLSRNRRTAEGALADSRATWRSMAGNAEPSVLLKDKPRIEELASHLQLISNEAVDVQGDTTILVGFASLLAELNRRFPAERVPLLVDDLFAEVEPQYHAVLRELLLRASHRRQVVLESADIIVTKWAAVEAVGGDAILITDHEIDVEPIIEQAVGPEAGTTV